MCIVLPPGITRNSARRKARTGLPCACCQARATQRPTTKRDNTKKHRFPPFPARAFAYFTFYATFARIGINTAALRACGLRGAIKATYHGLLQFYHVPADKRGIYAVIVPKRADKMRCTRAHLSVS